MKLWVKTAVGLGIVGTISGVAIGAVAIFNATSKKVDGPSFNTKKSMENGYDIPSIKSLQLENLNTYFVKNIGENTQAYAEYDPVKNEVEYNGKKVPFDKFNQAYIRKFNSSPVQVVKFGPALFQNEYLDAVNPQEFAQYVVWFLKNVSWGGDLAALENFSLRRGVKTEGSSVILGEHSNSNNEKTTIEFYPDGFFGSLPAYSTEWGAGQQNDNLLIKLSDINGTLLTLKDIEDLISKKEEIRALANIGEFRIRTIVPVQAISDPNDKTRDGQMGYEAYVDIYPNLIDDVLEIYPYLAKELDGWHVERDPKLIVSNGSTYHNDILKNGKYWGIDPSTRIPFLAVLAASNPDFKGVGINWLKYVGQHEYGHHITLQSLQDGSENGVYVGATSAQKVLNPGNFFSLDAIQKYLAARGKGITATKTGTEEKSAGEFIRFVEGTDLVNDQESNKDVYGSVFASDLTNAIDNERRRAGRISLTELAKVAQERGVSLQDLMIENAWDLNSASINPGFSGTSNVYSFDANGKAVLTPFKEAFDKIVTDGVGNPILQDFDPNDPARVDHNQAIIQYWVDDKGNKVEPAFYELQATQNGKVLVWTKPRDANLLKTWTALSPRKTVVFTKEKDDQGKNIPAVEDDCTVEDLYRKDQEITNFLVSFAWDYSINGWESKDTLASGIRFDVTAYKDGKDMSEQYSVDTSKSYSNLIASGQNSLFTFVANAENGLSSYDSKNGDYFSPKLTTTGQTVNDQLVVMGDLKMKISEEGLGFGAEKGLGSYFDVDGVKYTSLPSGNWDTWGRTGSRMDTAWETVFRQQKVGVADKMGLFVFAQKSKPNTILGGIAIEENGTRVRKLGFFEDVPNAADPTAAEAFLPSEANKDPNNEIAMFIKGDAYNSIGLKVKNSFPTITFDEKILPQTFKDWMQGGAKSGQMTVADYVKQFSVNPLTDFEFAKDNTKIKVANRAELFDAKGKTVLTRAALEKFFDVTEFIKQNNITETEAQVILTNIVTSENLALIQEFDKTKATEAELKTNQSLKAYLLQGDTVKTAKDALFSSETSIRKWYIKDISDADYEELISELFKAKHAWKDGNPSLQIDTNILTFNELTLLTGIRRLSFLSDADYAYKMIVGPTSDIRSYLQARNEDKLGDIFSNYTFDIAEMTNRDYLQITYTPGQETIENTPNWFNGTTEAESGFEYSIDSSNTKAYITSSLLAASYTTETTGLEAIESAIRKAFNFKINKWGQVEAEPNANGEIIAPSKGIVAASNLFHWRNYVNPNYIGQPVSTTNGFFKDDFIRRQVGTELYDNNGEWKYTLIGNDLYLNSTVKTAASKTPVGQYYPKGNNLHGAVIVDSTGKILAKHEGLDFVGVKGTQGENWTVDTSLNIVDKVSNTTIGTFDVKNMNDLPTKGLPITDTNGNVIAYIENQVLTTDNVSLQYKVIGKKVYTFDVATDYKNPDENTKQFQIQGNEIYNFDGTPIKDEQIKLKTIYGEKIEDRATAVWQWLLQSKGIGDGIKFDSTQKASNGKSLITGGRNIEGIWRSPDRDAIYAWGYIPTEMISDGKKVKAADVKYLEFKDTSTGEAHYVPVSVGQNNLYYYKDRTQLGLENPANLNSATSSISYIEDEGFTSWTSDFAAIGGYQDALLKSGHSYEMNLVDENHSKVMKIDLGTRTVIAENGKPAGKAPNVIRKNEQDVAVIKVQDQFNS